MTNRPKAKQTLCQRFWPHQSINTIYFAFCVFFWQPGNLTITEYICLSVQLARAYQEHISSSCLWMELWCQDDGGEEESRVKHSPSNRKMLDKHLSQWHLSRGTSKWWVSWIIALRLTGVARSLCLSTITPAFTVNKVSRTHNNYDATLFHFGCIRA